MMFNNIYRNKKVLITGHTGFKGTWLTFLLREMGADVCGFSLEPHTTPSHFKLLNLQKNIIHIVGDIRDSEALNQTMQDFQPEFVFHLAAQALVRESYVNPVETFDVNVMGSVNLLNAVEKCESVRALVYITSDKCYENVEWIWGYRENDQIGGRDPYSASKGAAELVFSAYQRSYFNSKKRLGVASARAGNVIGGGDWAIDRIIPDCIRAIESDTPIFLRNPNATRPWQHVLEPINGYLILGAKLYNHPDIFGGAWNFGPSISQIRTVKEVSKSIFHQIGSGSIEIDNSCNNQHEANILQLNCDKSRQELDWAPRWNVEETLTATSEWYKVFLNKGDIEFITRQQLYNFFPELL